MHALRAVGVLYETAGRIAVMSFRQAKETALLWRHLPPMRAAEHALDRFPKLASVQWSLYSQDKRPFQRIICRIFSSLVAYAEKLSIFRRHFSAVSFAKNYFHGLHDRGGKRSGNFL